MPIARWSLLSKAAATARSSQCISVTHTGVVAVYGGELKPRTPVDDGKDSVPKGSVHTFDLKAHVSANGSTDSTTWRVISPATGLDPMSIPEARVGATTVYDDGALYLWGGRGGVDMAPLSGIQAGFWRGILPAQGSDIRWERLQAVNEDYAPELRSYHASVIHQGKIYIHAGCPALGRLSALHSFDIATCAWKTLASAPDPARGGTTLALASIEASYPILLRYGGFCGYELPSTAGTLDIYSISEDVWHTVQPKADTTHGSPGPRSVHGFVSFRSPLPSLVDVVGVLYHGERDASTLGHAGAGTFWNDVWLLIKSAGPITEGWAWKKLEHGGTSPEGRGWLPSAVWVDDNGTSRIVMQGGLLSSNERSDELWLLEID